MPRGDLFDEMAPRAGDFYPPETRAGQEFRLSRKLVLVARRWTTLIDGALKASSGQNRARWQTLFAIAFAEPPVTTLTLSMRLSVQWPTLVRSLAALEAEGLVTRRDNPADGRSRIIALTDRGRAMLDRIQPVMDETRAAVMAGLTDEELALATRLLDTLLEGIVEVPGGEGDGSASQ